MTSIKLVLINVKYFAGQCSVNEQHFLKIPLTVTGKSTVCSVCDLRKEQHNLF